MMTMNYDFDIFDLVPQVALPDAETTGFLARLGLRARKADGVVHGADSGPDRVALFREAQTADALREGPTALREYFVAAGFGLNTYSSGAARHQYPATDEMARLEIIERLAALAPEFPLPSVGDAPEGGPVFRLGEFLTELAEARPAETVTHPDLAPKDAIVGPHPAPTFDTRLSDAVPVVATTRKFWQNRYFMTAVAVGIAVAVLQLTSAFDVMTLASL